MEAGFSAWRPSRSGCACRRRSAREARALLADLASRLSGWDEVGGHGAARGSGQARHLLIERPVAAHHGVPGRELSQRDREFSSRVREFGTASREFSLRAREFASLPRELAFAAREFSSPAREFGSIPRGFSQRSRGPRSKVRGDAGKTGERRAAFRGWADRPGFGGGGAGPGWTSR